MKAQSPRADRWRRERDREGGTNSPYRGLLLLLSLLLAATLTQLEEGFMLPVAPAPLQTVLPTGSHLQQFTPPHPLLYRGEGTVAVG